MKAVFDVKPGSGYDDDIVRRYQFPGKSNYLSAARNAIGDWVLYREPRRNGGRQAVLARENFPLKMMGTVIGGTAMAGSLSMALGPVAGGLIYDALASYVWLYVGAWAMGIGAFLMAMTFRPFPKAARDLGGLRPGLSLDNVGEPIEQTEGPLHR